MTILKIFLILAMVLGGSFIFDFNAPMHHKSTSAYAGTVHVTLFGFTPFPYDFTVEALEKTYSIITPNSTIIAFHLDDGIPWSEALADSAFPLKLQNEWTNSINHITGDKSVYLGLAPLDKDRVNLSHEMEGKKSAVWSDYSFDDSKVKTAYLNYARRAVKQFRPDFLNLGIEAGELALRKPSRWNDFVKLYDFVRIALKKEFPNLKIGISFSLQSLIKPDVAKLVKPVVDNSDYLCLSFYPNMSTFGEKFGAPALPSGQNSWIEPLRWVRSYTDKPLAICETGYSSKPVTVKSFDLQFPGDLVSQAAYVRDLIDIAKKDQYLFVVWFLSIDYDKLSAKLAGDSDVNNMWRNIGFFDGDLNPKPAWSVWKTFNSQTKENVLIGQSKSPNLNKAEIVAPPVINKTEAIVNNQQLKPNENFHFALRFRSNDDLLSCVSIDQVSIDDDEKSSLSASKAMRWSINYLKGQWNWCYKKINKDQLSGSSIVRLHIRSDIDGPIFVKLEESNKESFYFIAAVGKQWRVIEAKLSDFKIDDASRTNGFLDLNDISNIILADPGSNNGTTGHRNIWIDAIEIE